MSAAPRSRPNLVLVVVGAVLLTAMPLVLLRASLGGLRSDGDPVVWVNPSLASAGLGFAALCLLLVGWSAWRVSRGESLSGRPGPVEGGALAGAALLLGLGVAVGTEAVTSAYARGAGYARCPARDRFQAGNVRRNDVTLHAFVRRNATGDAVRATCSGLPVSL